MRRVLLISAVTLVGLVVGYQALEAEGVFPPVGGVLTSAMLDVLLGNTQGGVAYRGASVWSSLSPGTSGQFLQTQGTGANPQWASYAISIAAGCQGSFTSTGGTGGLMGMGGAWNSGACNATWTSTPYRVVSDVCTLRNLRVVSGAAGVSGSDGAVTVWYANSTATAPGTLASSPLSCTIGTNQSCNDTTDTQAIGTPGYGATVSVKIVYAASTTITSPQVSIDCSLPN